MQHLTKGQRSMTYKTHLIGGAQAGVLLAYLNNGTPMESTLLIGASLLGSVLPDIDHPDSKLSKKDILAKATSRSLQKVTVHRGFTHTIPGALTFALFFLILGLFRTGRESTFALLAMGVVFSLFFFMEKPLSKYAGIAAAATYIAAPAILDYATSQEIPVARIPTDHRAAYYLAGGIFAGCIMHMIYDSFTKGGIAWLWPLSKKKFRIARIKTNTRGEFGFRMLQLLVLVVMLAFLGKEKGVIEWISELFHQLTDIEAYVGLR